MAVVHGKIEPLEKIINLIKHIDGAKHLRSLEDVLAFKKTCEQRVYEIELRIRREQGLIIDGQKLIISKLENEYSARIIEARDSLILKPQSFNGLQNDKRRKIGYFFKRVIISPIRLFKEKYVNWILRKVIKKIQQEQNKLKIRETSLEDIIKDKVRKEAKSFYEAKRIIELNQLQLIGAVGEQRVLDELRKLPDTFTVINNFQLYLNKALYYRNNNEWINSVQADHIVVGPSGVFLIETKNWSQRSVDKLVDFTPIDQIKRTNFALFCYLNQKQKRGLLSLLLGKKGKRKVTVRNILVMVNAMTDEKDQFVKVLRPIQLISYIEYFAPSYGDEDIRQVLERLIAS